LPITPFLNGEQFNQDTLRILGVAFEQTCIALRIGDCDDDVKQAIANKIIELARTGERNPDLLCERALEGIREPQVRPGDAFSPMAARGMAEKIDQ
jgi:hypothetical protein